MQLASWNMCCNTCEPRIPVLCKDFLEIRKGWGGLVQDFLISLSPCSRFVIVGRIVVTLPEIQKSRQNMWRAFGHHHFLMATQSKVLLCRDCCVPGSCGSQEKQLAAWNKKNKRCTQGSPFKCKNRMQIAQSKSRVGTYIPSMQKCECGLAQNGRAENEF